MGNRPSKEQQSVRQHYALATGQDVAGSHGIKGMAKGGAIAKALAKAEKAEGTEYQKYGSGYRKIKA